MTTPEELRRLAAAGTPVQFGLDPRWVRVSDPRPCRIDDASECARVVDLTDLAAGKAYRGEHIPTSITYAEEATS